MEKSNTALLDGRKPTPPGEVVTADVTSPKTAIPEAAPETQQPGAIAPEPESPRKKKPVALILAVLGVVAIVGGTFGNHWWQYASTHEDTDDATVAGHIHQVSSRINDSVQDVLVKNGETVHQGQLLVKLDPRDYQIQVQQAQAALETAKRQALAAQANIALASETASASTTQAQGDFSAAQAAIASAKAAVVQAQTGIPAAEAAVREAEAGIPVAKAQLAQANATLERTQADDNRYETLYTQGAVTGQQRDAAKAAYQVALSQKQAAQDGIRQAEARLAQARVGVTQAQAAIAQAQEGVANAVGKLESSKGGIEQANAKGQQTQVNRSQYQAAQAAIAQSEAALKNAQQQLAYTDITAPVDGIVGNKNVEIGNRVQPGQPVMALVGNEIWVYANFKETQLENMRPGEPVEIKLDAFPHHPFEGHIESVSPASGAQFALLPPDNATGNFTKVVQRVPVKVVFDPQSIKGYESRIDPGMSADVSVKVK